MIPHLTEIQASLAPSFLVLGLALILPWIVDRYVTWQRTALYAITMALALRYVWWRATETIAPFGFTVECAASWSLFAFEMGAMVATMSSMVMQSRLKARTDEVEQNLNWYGQAGKTPKIAIMIATYNEEKEVLERTIVGAQFLSYTNKEIMVLDDGGRSWLEEYCDQRGVRYIRRPDNAGAKAGNINHALTLLEAEGAPPDFVAVLDADFVPHRGFLSRSLALFHDPKVGLVQTPQHFFNADPIQHNLGLSRSYPDEQRYFFDHIQPSRDAWGIAFCCGTSSMARWTALQDIGGLPTESITEDFMVTLVLRNAGWNTVYLNEALTEGLAPEGLQEYVSQRARWCIGMMQIARSNVGPFAANKLRLRDRWSVIDSGLYWITTFPFRLAALVFPLLYWFFNITVVNATVPDVLRYFGTFYVWTMLTMQILSKGMLVPLVQDVTQLVGAIPITRAAFSGLLRPKGHKFVVTAKGGDRSKIVVQWYFMMPFLILTVLTVIGLLIGIVSDRFAFNDAGGGKSVVLFWTFYNLGVLTLTLVACVELPRHEAHVADNPEQATFISETGAMQTLWISKLTGDTAFVRGAEFAIGARGQIDIADIGRINCYTIANNKAQTRLQLEPTETQYESMIVKFYTADNVPGISRGRAMTLIPDLADRLARVFFK
ncbi:glycosyltransferase [Loktanella sp. 5RATIMAR09]|uniref:glycosyltransferase n=1 Tax=Loktanella sp. 5RATIMAR09 TaxID=1225655 RepID=UPI000AD10321|nr:glycosyltransferase [Loktanella sp. 5RATIMAR09]